jgi:2-polyprenyl-3-methyl-5-hydroxy-6-metoxy-1,4-benzoquinol methylase
MFKKDPLLSLDNSLHSPHSIIPKLIKKEQSLVLDVGCNTGMIGEEIIRKKKSIVDGIDINRAALDEAGKAYRKVFEFDLSVDGIEIDTGKYDYIIFSDILEHLPRPDQVLKKFSQYLKDEGRIIVSLPNVARFEVRLELLFGNFDYKPGILSEDHLRFFTQKSAIKMIKECGYEVEKIIPTGLGHKLRIFLNLTAFQFIYVCEKKTTKKLI